ncbi:c-type cytochrome [Candidatus Electronema sp. PJ]|jgi:cytochrome c|uniref:c-type cytochrome n=1 Tax=Candidatus Electronema sp. PJ TaxID=3401572 RepID=UPI003AA86F3B
MKYALLGCAVACLLVSGSAFASEELAKKNCMVCHQLDKAGMGPSMKDISKKFAADKEGEQKIVTVIQKGSKDATGPGKMMAPMANVSEADAKAIATWILSLAAEEKK